MQAKETTMTSTPVTLHTPGRWSAKAAALTAIAIAAAWAATVPAAASAALAAGQPLPARYHYQTITLPGYPSVYVNGISASGGYAGEGCKDRNCTKVALFAASPAGKITFYTLPFTNYTPTGPFNTTATGMDNAGGIVGAYTDAQGGFHGFVRSANGALAQINDPQAAAGGTVADGISPDGSVIVGFYLDKAGTPHGFLLRDGTFSTYDVPGAQGTVMAFDNHGEPGGTYIAANGASRGFYLIHGKLHTLRAPAESGARHPGVTLSAVDTGGTLFGYVTSANLPGYGIAYANGRYTTFRDPNQAGTGPQAGTVIYSANSNGAVAGAYTYTNGTPTQFPYAKGFIARPDRSPHPARATQPG
jgi:uncharacterized membrane protein